MRLIVTILVTFAALVLGLLVTSAKDDFDQHTALYQRDGIDLAELDRRLVEYGDQAKFDSVCSSPAIPRRSMP